MFSRNGTLFLSTDLRSDAHQSQIIGGDADEDHTQIVGGHTVNILGGYILPFPPCYWHHCYSPSVGLSTKMQIKKYQVFSTSETVFCTEIDQKVTSSLF